MKKVLVISYYFPPAGGPGVQRWLKFVKYLRGEGVEPVMYIPENAKYPMEDTSLLYDVPKDLKIYRGSIFEPNNFFSSAKNTSGGFIDTAVKKQSFKSKALTWIRANFFIPDARCMWIRPSIRRVEKIIKDEGINTIITTGPPHSLHMIGLGVKKKHHDIQWIADFRDPWTKIDYFHNLPLTRWAEKKHRNMEKEVLSTADDVITVTPSVAKDYMPMCHGRMHMITNGYDTADMPTEKITPDALFSISHFGTINAQRNPETLWKVLGDMCRENEVFSEKLSIQLSGSVSGEVFSHIEKNGLTPHLNYQKYLPHAEVIKKQHSSQMLLMLMYRAPEGAMFIVGKLFEYLAACRPILVVGYSKGDAASIVEKTASGTAVDFDDYKTLRAVVEKQFSLYLKGADTSVKSYEIEQYSRKALTHRLAQEVILQ
ncbi:MAG: glycosyltransferase [Flavobacteriales bacterium]|nr:glycosyltransferase [Flavobacteriales bacterium]